MFKFEKVRQFDRKKPVCRKISIPIREKVASITRKHWIYRSTLQVGMTILIIKKSPLRSMFCLPPIMLQSQKTYPFPLLIYRNVGIMELRLFIRERPQSPMMKILYKMKEQILHIACNLRQILHLKDQQLRNKQLNRYNSRCQKTF